MRSIILFIFLFMCSMAYGHHNKGGFIAYTYLGQGSTPQMSKYKIKVVHYIDCANAKIEGPYVVLGIFIGTTSQYYSGSYYKIMRSAGPLSVPSPNMNPCITNAPNICYQYCEYESTIELPDNADGYRLVEQQCCRADNIINLENSGTLGYTFDAFVPGGNVSSYYHNSSPLFPANNMAGIICHSADMVIDLSTSDPDADELEYIMAPALDGGVQIGNGYVDITPLPGPYQSLQYTSGYSPEFPLGTDIALDPHTGILTGTAPNQVGAYIIAFYILERRNGEIIGRTRREIQFTVADCNLHAAQLKPAYINCDDLSKFQFNNELNNTSITNYVWDFGDQSPVSNEKVPEHIYANAGEYTVTLKVQNAAGCNDQASSIAKAYPGFSPEFSYTGGCLSDPFLFQDRSTTNYGHINGWTWDLGEGDPLSGSKDMSHTFSTAGTKSISLTVSNSVGCVKSTTSTLEVFEKPQLSMPFSDTLICNGDQLPVSVLSEGTGNTYTWTPGTDISNTTSPNTVLYPANSTDYQLTVANGSCQNSARVHVNVIDQVSISSLRDTSLCIGDTAMFTPVSDGLEFRWEEDPSGHSLSDNTTKSTLFYPRQTTRYILHAKVGHCVSEQAVTVTTAAYPTVTAGIDQLVCEGKSTHLSGSTNSKDYYWTVLGDDNKLKDNSLLLPVQPTMNTSYILTGGNNPVCPKWVSDTVVIKIVPRITLSGLHDTAIQVGSRLPLFALSTNSDVNYHWFPSEGLDNPDIANPVANYARAGDYRYLLTATGDGGCKGTANIAIRVYVADSHFFVPSAFTPNADGKNDFFAPVGVGIVKFNLFQVYNRWGMVVFQSKGTGLGWDGLIKGQPAPVGTYVYWIEAISDKGESLSQKGTVVLIR